MNISIYIYHAHKEVFAQTDSTFCYQPLCLPPFLPMSPFQTELSKGRSKTAVIFIKSKVFSHIKNLFLESTRYPTMF